jgi:Ca2+-binding EF-hand superfamily protein
MTPASHERLRQLFESLDVDADGHIERDEWEAPARRILDTLGEPATSPKAQAVIASYQKMWDYLARQAGAGNGSLTVSQFERVADRCIINSDDAGFNDVLRDAVSAVAELFERDAKGAVTEEGFRSWLRAAGEDASKAREAFRKIDKDHDGDLTVDELMQATREYHAGELDVSVLGA